MISKELENALEKWTIYNRDKQFQDEFLQLLEECNEKKLESLFLSRLEFGTAGLRGRMGAGFACMNDVVVIQAAQGLLQYIIQEVHNIKEKGIVIGYDGRHYSKRFAELSATIFINGNIKVYLFSDLVPTPFISFGINHLKAGAGIMVTASHNPKDDNGYKLYWETSTQIISPHDKGIRESILKNLEPRKSSWETQIISGHSLIEDPLQLIFDAYTSRCLTLAFDLDMNKESDFLFTYTAMHGVGYKYIKEIFRNLKLKPLLPVTEQVDPDPEFPTVKFPNPEEGKSALNLSIDVANRNGSTIILSNDPDADRFAVAEKLRRTGEWKIYTGNETGALLGWWLLHIYKMKNPDKKDLSDVYFIYSTVSSKILQTIAKYENMSYEETLTGFKWIGNKMYDLLKMGKTVLFAFEESIGFMCDSKCLDKDGITAALRMTELILFLDKKGLTIYDKLEEIYSTYGRHVCENSYYFCYDKDIVKKIFHRIRNWNGIPNKYPESIANGKYKISGIRDLNVGFDSNMPDNKPILPISKTSEMITFNFENDFVCTLRTSGTEPKIKYYVELISSANESNTKKVEQTLKEMLEVLLEDFLQPSLNNLIPKSD